MEHAHFAKLLLVLGLLSTLAPATQAGAGDPPRVSYTKDKIARASDAAAPDGCHLHFEKRAFEGGLSTAVWPRKMLALKAKG